MKKTILYLSCVTALLTGCTKDFDAINSDPTATNATAFNPNYLLSQSQWEMVSSVSGYQGPILFQSGWVQIFASTSSGSANYYTNADKYVESSNTLDYRGRSWIQGYRAASLAYEMKQLTEGKDQYSNLNKIATIMKVLCLHQLTDIYGDIPYSEALMAKQGNTTPAYDKQQAVYTSMLSELETATAGLDASKDAPISDQFYGGNIAQWKKFGYSLMLRLAMRLTKVDAATAKTYAEKAAAGGTMTVDDDNALILGNNAQGFSNNNSNALRTVDDLYQVRWSKVLVDYMKTKSDPRLSVIAEVPAAGLAANNADNGGDNTAANQLGLPSGYDMNDGATDITKSSGYPGSTGTGSDLTKIGKYSRPRAFYRNQDAPLYVLTRAETELLLAEAAARGWNVGGTASSHYAAGVAAALTSLSSYGTSATISAATAATYAASIPLTTTSTDASLKEINEQLWLATGTQLNFVEAWSNWRRSGYPTLTAVNYTGNFSGGTIPRRQPYNANEPSLNPTGYASGVSSLGGSDSWSARVWWDKQ